MCNSCLTQPNVDTMSPSLQPMKCDIDVLLQLLMDNSLDVFYSFDVNSLALTYISPAIKHWSMTDIEVIGRPISDFIHPDDIDGVMRDIATTVATGQEFLSQFRVVTTRGQIVLVEEFGKAIWQNEQVVQITGILRDITEHKRIEHVSRASETRFQAMIEHSADAIALLGPDGTFLYASPAVARINGYDGHEFRGKFALALIHPDDLSQVEHHFQQLCAVPGAIIRMQCRLWHRDGTIRWIDMVGQNWLHEPAVRAIVVNFRDITEHQQAAEEREFLLAEVQQRSSELESLNDTLEQRIAQRTAELVATNSALRESEEKFRTIADASQAGIFVIQDECLVYVNDAIVTACGYSRDELVHMSITELIHPDDRERLLAYMHERWAGSHAPKRLEGQFITKHGANLWGDFSMQIIHYGGQSALMGIIIDITERKQLEEALREADRTKDVFLAVLSHELQTPLTAILGWSSEALRTQTPEFMTQAMAIVQRNATRQKQMVNEILDISRLIHHKIDLHLELLDLGDQVRQAIENIHHTIEERQIRLCHESPATPLPIHADAARIQQCIDNLLSNSLKFTPAGGLITVCCRRDGDQACLTVADTGRGISPEVLPMVFHYFRQADHAERDGGLGLGLAITHGIIELHGGSISVESEGIGHGSRFTIVLPVAGDAE